MKLSEYADKNNITYAAAYKRFKSGKIENAYQTETGSVLIKEEDTTWKDDLIELQKEKIKKLQKGWEQMSSIAESDEYDIGFPENEPDKNVMFAEAKDNINK